LLPIYVTGSDRTPR